MATTKPRASAKKPATTAKKTTAKSTKRKTTRKPAKPALAVRNLHNCEVRFRLGRQEKEGERATTLKPRGERADIFFLQKGDEDDPNLRSNVELGLFEIITQTEAKQIQEKQAKNRQTAVHPSLALLRNERGEPYEENQIRMESSWDERSIPVAHLDETGQIPSQGRGIDWIKTRDVVAPGTSPLVTQAQVPNARPSDQSAAAADAKARGKRLQGPDAGLPDGAHVIVEPTRKT